MWHVYILECADGSFYTGIAKDVAARMAQHSSGTGAKYTKGRGPFILRLEEPYATRSEALKRELAIKALSREQKLQLIQQR